MTGVPVSSSIEPQCAPNTSGIRSWLGERPSRTAITTTTGSSAATAPLTEISALSTPTSSIMNTISRVRLVPACVIRSCPAQAVTPVTSSPALSTNSEATKIVAGSPKPASAWFSVSSPLAHSASAQPRQTITTGKRSHMNSATTAPMMAKTVQISLTSNPCSVVRRMGVGMGGAGMARCRFSSIRSAAAPTSATPRGPVCGPRA